MRKIINSKEHWQTRHCQVPPAGIQVSCPYLYCSSKNSQFQNAGRFPSGAGIIIIIIATTTTTLILIINIFFIKELRAPKQLVAFVLVCITNSSGAHLIRPFLHIYLPLNPSLSITPRRVCAEPPALEPQAPPVQRGHPGHDDGGALRRRRPHHRQRLEEGRLDKQPVGEELAAGTVNNPDLAVCGGVLQQALLLLGGTELHHRWPPWTLPMALVPW